jgi:hypothetical protein
MAKMIPKEALDYIKNKKLKFGFSYKDVWREEHATAFTVAKAMQLDVLSDLHNAVTDAMEKGQSFESFKKNIKPLLRKKGWSGEERWWGKKEVFDPHTKKMVTAQLGSDRRLKTIYNVNMRSAYQKGQYDRAMKSDLHPYFVYLLGPSKEHREEHVKWRGLILPKDDPWWDAHFPPNGWGCKCYTRAVSEARKKQYEENGIPSAPRLDGSGGKNVPARTQAPPDRMRYFYNDRKRCLEAVPGGVDPAFAWNPGKAARNAGAQAALQKAQERYAQAVQNVTPVIADRQRTAELQHSSNSFFKKLERENPAAFEDMSFYSGGGGPEINTAVYTTDWENGPHAELIRSLDDTISKSPALDAETWFFKGDEAAHWNKAILGKSMRQKGFISTSALKSRAESYITEGAKAEPFMVVIRAPEGTKGLYIGSNTAYDKSGPFKKNEYEYLLPRNTKFHVLEKSESHIVVEVVP